MLLILSDISTISVRLGGEDNYHYNIRAKSAAQFVELEWLVGLWEKAMKMINLLYTILSNYVCNVAVPCCGKKQLVMTQTDSQSNQIGLRVSLVMTTAPGELYITNDTAQIKFIIFIGLSR